MKFLVKAKANLTPPETVYTCALTIAIKETGASRALRCRAIDPFNEVNQFWMEIIDESGQKILQLSTLIDPTSLNSRQGAILGALSEPLIKSMQAIHQIYTLSQGQQSDQADRYRLAGIFVKASGGAIALTS